MKTLHLPVTPQIVRLSANTPLSFLAEVFPDGVPVSPYSLSIDGRECYEFSPDALPDSFLLRQIGLALASEGYPVELLRGSLRYGAFLIPIEWVNP